MKNSSKLEIPILVIFILQVVVLVPYLLLLSLTDFFDGLGSLLSAWIIIGLVLASLPILVLGLIATIRHSMSPSMWIAFLPNLLFWIYLTFLIIF